MGEGPPFPRSQVDHVVGLVLPAVKRGPADHQHIHRDLQRAKRQPEADHLVAKALKGRFDHQEIQVAVFAGLAPGIRTEQNDLDPAGATSSSRRTASWIVAGSIMNCLRTTQPQYIRRGVQCQEQPARSLALASAPAFSGESSAAPDAPILSIPAGLHAPQKKCRRKSSGGTGSLPYLCRHPKKVPRRQQNRPTSLPPAASPPPSASPPSAASPPPPGPPSSSRPPVRSG